MIINRLVAKNWRNFREIDVHLSEPSIHRRRKCVREIESS